MTRKLVAATALVVCVAVPAAMAQKPPKQPKQVSISAVPNPVTFRDLVAISGKLTGPKGGGEQSIALREDPFPFGDLIELGTIFTDGQGNYSYGGRLVPINTRYQVRWGAVESEIVTVLARPRISLRVSDRTPAARSRVRLYGKVCTEHDGATLLIQRRVAPERWRTVGGTTLTDAPTTFCSTYSRQFRIYRDSVFRTVLPTHADHTTGRSPARHIDAH